jgi:hypothetical protein
MRSTLCALAIVLALCGATRAFSQAPDGRSALIEWSADRKLDIRDFKARVPALSGDASRSWVAIETDWGCREGQAFSEARAVFDPSRSWWRNVDGNLWQGSDDSLLLSPRDDHGRALLVHEQVHFDLTEVWARKIRAQFKALPEACKVPGGTRGIENAIADFERGWEREQKTYDDDTDHGANAVRQKAWTLKTEKALQSSR